ncbi:carboxypeptidase A4 [Dissophora ornata]|nr:carboxypeptidase A4 [Dissophora ornata]
MKLSLFSLSAVVALTALLNPSPSFALPAPSISINSVVSFDNHRVIRIQVNSETDLQTLTANENSLGLDYFTHHKVVGGHIDVRIPPQSFNEFQRLNLKYSTLIENLQSVIDQERKEDEQYQQLWVFAAADTWFQGYHTYADHQSWLATQISNNRGKASAFSAGKSYQGRDQAGITIGSGPNHIVFHGTQHAREWISTMVVEYLVDQLLKGTDSRVAGYLTKYTFHILPIMNPDGFVVTQTTNRMHRKNAQTNGGCLGTDTNRNWGFKWNTGGSSANPCADDYMGPSAFSSPEATNIAKYLKSLPKVVSYIDFHSYSQLWMVPYGYTGTRPGTYAYMNGLASKAVKALEAVNGVKFTNGDIYNTIYGASGNSADYAYSIGVSAPFAVELRDTGRYGFSLPASQIVPSGQETWAAFAAILDNIQV